MSKFSDLVESPFILAEGAVIERLRREGSVQLDPWVDHAGFVDDPAGLAAIEQIERGYLDIGRTTGIPLMLFTSTWHANPERLANAGLYGKEINRRSARFLLELVGSYGDYATKVLVGGLIGSRRDAYRPAEALRCEEAREFHREQIGQLATSGVDFLCAATLPAISEAAGIAMAMSETPLPYVISFVIGGDGRLLDGTPIHEAIASIRNSVSRPPAFFMVNCVHPSVFRASLTQDMEAAGKVIGLQANTSPRSPRELDGLQLLETEDPETLAEAMITLRKDFGLRILGGCCGTDDRHIRAIARKASAIS